jgi:hypothetical protein
LTKPPRRIAATIGAATALFMLMQSQRPPFMGVVLDVAVQNFGEISIGIRSILSQNSVQLDHLVRGIEPPEKGHSQAKRLLD